MSQRLTLAQDARGMLFLSSPAFFARSIVVAALEVRTGIYDLFTLPYPLLAAAALRLALGLCANLPSP